MAMDERIRELDRILFNDSLLEQLSKVLSQTTSRHLEAKDIDITVRTNARQVHFLDTPGYFSQSNLRKVVSTVGNSEK